MPRPPKSLDAKRSELLGSIRPDPIGSYLGSPFVRFNSPLGIHGLMRVNGDRLELLAVNAWIPDTGQLRAFMRHAETLFDSILVMDVMNPFLPRVLMRWGYAPESVDNFLWSKPKSL